MKTMLFAGRFCKKREKEGQDKKLALEFKNYSENIRRTNSILQKFIFIQELKRTGLLLTTKEAEEKAQALSQNLLDCNLIKDGLIVAGMLEYIQQQIA